MEKRIEGEDGTMGAISHWAGNEDVGAGYQTVKSLEPNERMETTLHFLEPYESEAETYIILEEIEGGTKVSWGFETIMPYPFNVMSLFTDLDQIVGPDFSYGLELLKGIVEKQNQMTFGDYTIQKVKMPHQHFLGFRKKVRSAEITGFYTEYYPQLMQFIQQTGHTPCRDARRHSVSMGKG